MWVDLGRGEFEHCPGDESESQNTYDQTRKKCEWDLANQKSQHRQKTALIKSEYSQFNGSGCFLLISFQPLLIGNLITD